MHVAFFVLISFIILLLVSGGSICGAEVLFQQHLLVNGGLTDSAVFADKVSDKIAT